jgi:trimethylamine---corrinoid protein Co-methyltransferase
MHVAGHPYAILKQDEIERIHRSALTILEEMGMEIANPLLLGRLAEVGLPVDQSAQRVRFPAGWVEKWITEAEKYNWESLVPSISASAGIYFSQYQDPATRALVPWTERRLAHYIALARRLPNVGSATLLGSRFEDLPGREALYERYYAWKWGASEGGSILQDELCPALLELYQAAASYRNQSIRDLFRATVYLVPALKLGRHEAYQVAYFWERGLRVGTGGSMLTMGANAPVTLAGAVCLNLAEQLALRILDWALWDDRCLSIYSSIAPLDMRTLIRPFGRPEMAIANLMTAQIARYYGAYYSGHGGLTDAKLPSAEAGYQKALSAVSLLMAGGSLWMDAGLLAIDEVASPVQMVLDNEFLGALKRFTHEFEVDDEAIGLEMILAAGPGGSYAAEMHTASHFRNELWQPTIWAREMLGVWMSRGSKLDADKAAEIALAVEPMQPQISEEFEKDIMNIIENVKIKS